MSQRCPVCKTRLWTDALLIPGRLNCPRCGATFRPTVPWVYFRFLLLVVVTLALVVVLNYSHRSLWLLVLLLGVAISCWSLPRFIDLQRISGDLRVTEGPVSSEQMKLKLEGEEWEDDYGEAQEKIRFREAFYWVIALVLLLLILAALR